MAKLSELEAAGKVIRTHNQMGHSYLDLNEFSLAFIDYASRTEAPVLDMGAAFGVATLPALRKGAKVIANDLEAEHLKILMEKASPEEQKNLDIRVGKIPGDVSFPENTLGAIHSCLVFLYLTGEEVFQTVSLMYKWLQPGGKVFIITASPYRKTLKKFIPLYEARKEAGDPWPGFIEDLTHYPSEDQSEAVLKSRAKKVSVVDADLLKTIFMNLGFYIERAEHFNRSGYVADHVKYEGREDVGLIAQKPL